MILSAVMMAVLLAGPGASANDSPEAVVRAFYATEAANDWRGAMALFSSTSDPVIRRQIRDDLRVNCVDVDSLRVESVDVSADSAIVSSVAHVIRRRLLDGPVLDELEERRFSLRREDGAWRIVELPSAEDDLAMQLVAAKDDEAVTALLARNENRISALLARRLFLDAVFRTNSGSYDAKAAAIVTRIGATVGDKSSIALGTCAEATGRREAGARSPEGVRVQTLEGLRIAEASNDPTAIVFCANMLATWMFANDAIDDVEKLMRSVLETPRAYAPRDVSAMQANLGLARFVRGDYAAAYQVFAEGVPSDLAEDLLLEAGFKEVHIGRIMAAQNDPQLALDYFLRAAQRPIHPRFVIMAWVGAADAYRAMGRLDEAKAAADKAIAIGRPKPFKGMTATAFVAAAKIAVDRGDTAGAEELLQQALANGREANYGIAVVDSLLALGNLHYRQGKPAEAKKEAAQVVDIVQRSEALQADRYPALMLSGRAAQALAQRDDAIAAYTAAVEAVESARNVVAGGERQQELFFEPYQAAYAELAGLMLDRNEIDDALVYAERGKGRVLLDTFARERRRAENALPEEERQKLAAAVKTLGEANKRLVALRVASGNADALHDAEAEQQRAQLALEQLEAHAAALDPALRTTGSAAIVDRAALDTLVTRDDFAILEYVARASGTDLIVVRRNGGAVTVSGHRIATNAEELSRLVDTFRRQLANRDLGYRRSARALYDLLLAPAADELQGKKILCVVPDGVLWNVPFEALADSAGRFVVERFSCFSVPSISVYRSMLERAGGGEHAPLLAAFGNPDIGAAREEVSARYRGVQLEPLPEAELEAREVARLWRPHSVAYTGAVAREGKAKEELARADVVHFAAHGLFDDDNPMFSQILLARDAKSSEDGVLQAWELMHLDVHARLVVLSACETARGRIGAGEGLIGMSWALFAGGCPSTVASRWNVASASTAELMVAFHRRLARPPRGPFAKVDALRAAQLALLKSRGTAHPFYWAAFTLIGSAAW